MAIPNTTPTPNELYNGEMRKMSDTELRVVLVVTRATLGWELDHETGMRKKEDWISQKQLTQQTGKSNKAISTAIDSCVKKGWIEARDKEGNFLMTPEDRARKRIFYRLGRIFLSKIESAEVTSQDKKPQSSELAAKSGEVDDTNLVKKVHSTKESITKETIQNQAAPSAAGEKASLINELIEEFKSVNPSWRRLFGNKTQRACLQRLLDQHGAEKVRWLIQSLPASNKTAYAPTITTPFQLEERLGNLIAYWRKQKSKNEESRVHSIV